MQEILRRYRECMEQETMSITPPLAGQNGFWQIMINAAIYHTKDRRDHWKFRNGSLPGVNERRQEVCVVSTGNNNHRREGEAQCCTSCCGLNVSMTANVPQARHIFLLQCETSVCSWTCLGSFEHISPPLQKASSVLNALGAERKAESPKVKLGQQPW